MHIILAKSTVKIKDIKHFNKYIKGTTNNNLCIKKGVLDYRDTDVDIIDYSELTNAYLTCGLRGTLLFVENDGYKINPCVKIKFTKNGMIIQESKK